MTTDLTTLKALGKRRISTRAELKAIAAEIRKEVPRARDAGATMEEVGEALGITRAAVYKLLDGTGSR